MKLRVIEEFVTYQGSGRLVGTRQYFVRLAGCGVMDCPIRAVCDEPDALNAKHGDWRVPSEIAARASGAVRRGGWIHITGGEPFDQPKGVTLLALEAHSLGLKIHIQTSGVYPIDLPQDWITVSPKRSPDKLEVKHGAELILVDDGSVTLEDLRMWREETDFKHYYLMPLWGMSPKVVLDKVEHANKCLVPWSFTDQMHKRWGVK